MVSPIVHFQLVAKDIEAAKKFYGEVMGWDFPEPDGDSPVGIDTGWADDISVMGSFAQAEGPMAPALNAVIRLDDVPAALAKCTELGGTVVMEPTLLPAGVTIAVIQTPEGIAHTLVQQ